MKPIFLSFMTLLSLNIIAQTSKKSVTIDDLLSLKSIREVEISPDNYWVAYTVTTIDTLKDKSNTQIWMVSTEGGDPIPMTGNDYSASRPRWSPDGKYLSFMASKGENSKTQVWNLNRLGGEAVQVTSVKQGVSSYDWSPDGKKLVLTIKDPRPSDLTKDTKDDKKPLPYVIDRIHFKQDYSGYLDRRRNHIYVYTPGDSSAIQITSGDYDDYDPNWSPDGKWIAFVSNRSENPDLSYDNNIWLVDPMNQDKGATLKQVTTNPVTDSNPRWSPDSKSLVYVTSINGDIMPFSMSYIATIRIDGGSPRILTQELDRKVTGPQYSEDGNKIYFSVSDSGERYLASIGLDGGNFNRYSDTKMTLSDYSMSNDVIYTLHSTAYETGAIYKHNKDQIIKLTKENDNLLSGITLGSHEKVEFKSKDGTGVEAYVIKPYSFDPSNKYPLVLWIHGGPIGQYNYSMHTTGQLLAANGYIVLLVNPRGSTGHGEDFTKAIFADWGNKDYDDVMAGVDYMIDQGYVDENRLGVGGWSYGGILTNYVITKTDIFKAAISGASLGIVTANFGHDQYVKWYNAEFGMPWENWDVWKRLSPFYQIENITTPTLWMGGSVDWNVPIINSEQMYLGMKSLGRETQLVVYPGEHHGIRRPSFQKDRWQRWISWYDKYLK